MHAKFLFNWWFVFELFKKIMKCRPTETYGSIITTERKFNIFVLNYPVISLRIGI